MMSAPFAVLRLGLCALICGQLLAGLAARAAVAQAPVLVANPVDQTVARALELAETHQFSPAESILAEVLKSNPNHPGALYEYATVLSWDGKYDESLVTYRKLLAVQPENHGLHLEMARVLLWQADLEKRPACAADALAECDSMLVHDPRNVEALKLSAAIDLRFSRYLEARMRLDRALRAAPEDAEATRLMAEAWEGARQHDQAIGLLRAYLKVHPAVIALRWSLADILVKRGRLGEAAEEYRYIIRLNPGHDGAHVALGRILCWQGRVGESRRHYDAARQLSPQSVGPVLGLADLQAAIGRWDRAASLYGNAMQLEPNSRQARAGYTAARWEEASGLSSEYGRSTPSAGLEREWIRSSLDFRWSGSVTLSLGSTRWNYFQTSAPRLGQLDYWASLQFPVGRLVRVAAQATRSDFGDQPTSKAGLYGGSIAISGSPLRRMNISANYARLPVTEGYATIRPQYYSDVFAAGADWSPIERLSIRATGQFTKRNGMFAVGYWNEFYGRWIALGDLLDRSEHRSVDGQVTWRFDRRPEISVGYRLHLQDARQAADLPYWAPEFYRQHGPLARFGAGGGFLRIGAQGQMTRSSISDRWGWGASGWAAVRVASHAEFLVTGRYDRADSSVPWDGTTLQAALRLRT